MRNFVGAAGAKSRFLRPTRADNKNASIGCFFVPAVTLCLLLVVLSVLSGGSLIALPSQATPTIDANIYLVDLADVIGDEWQTKGNVLDTQSSASVSATKYRNVKKLFRVSRHIWDEMSFVQQEVALFENAEAASAYFHDREVWSFKQNGTIGSFVGPDIEAFEPTLKSVGKHYLGCLNGERDESGYANCVALFLCSDYTVWVRIQTLIQFRMTAGATEITRVLSAVDARCMGNH